MLRGARSPVGFRTFPNWVTSAMCADLSKYCNFGKAVQLWQKVATLPAFLPYFLTCLLTYFLRAVLTVVLVSLLFSCLGAASCLDSFLSSLLPLPCLLPAFYPSSVLPSLAFLLLQPSGPPLHLPCSLQTKQQRSSTKSSRQEWARPAIALHMTRNMHTHCCTIFGGFYRIQVRSPPRCGRATTALSQSKAETPTCCEPPE